jgi:hypothetical protein
VHKCRSATSDYENALSGLASDTLSECFQIISKVTLKIEKNFRIPTRPRDVFFLAKAQCFMNAERAQEMNAS